MVKTISMSSWVEITNKYPAKCKNCGKEIDVDEKVLWKKGVGVKHVDPCEPEEDIGIRDDNSALVIIEENEWVDPKPKSYKELQKVKICQCCGKDLKNNREMFFNVDRKTCEGCFQQ